MRVEVVNTGTELLLGNVINSHLAFFGQELFPLGLRIARQVTVPDGKAIRDALQKALADAEIVLITGGLGPTTDDITREITTELLGLELFENAVVLQAITERFARRGIEMTERVKRQAQVPHGATVIPNFYGTAPGLYLKAMRGEHVFRNAESAEQQLLASQQTDVHLFLLPGPPRELKPMFRDQVLPILKTILPPTLLALEHRNYRVIGLGESNVEALIGDDLLAIGGMELGYCAQPGQVEVRCIGTATMLKRAERIILEKLGAHVIASRDEIRSLEQVIVESLTRLGKT